MIVWILGWAVAVLSVGCAYLALLMRDAKRGIEEIKQAYSAVASRATNDRLRAEALLAKSHQHVQDARDILLGTGTPPNA